MLRKAVLALAVLGGITAASTAMAIPELQIYIDGATYVAADPSDPWSEDSWVVNAGTFDLWVIGDVEAKGTISDVKLSAAYLSSEEGMGSVTLASTTTGGLGGFTDPSTPGAPIMTISGNNDGDVPQFGDGSDLPTHGVFGSGTSFYQWALGDFDKTDSPIADFITSFPSPTSEMGQINAYTVTVTGFSRVHFDAFNSYLAHNGAHYIKAPFSHDGEAGGGGGGSVPEPGAMLLFGTGLVGLVAAKSRKK